VSVAFWPFTVHLLEESRFIFSTASRQVSDSHETSFQLSVLQAKINLLPQLLLLHHLLQPLTTLVAPLLDLFQVVYVFLVPRNTKLDSGLYLTSDQC